MKDFHEHMKKCNFQTFSICKVVTIFISFGLVWFGLVLWYIKHCWLFNAKSSLYIYIKYKGFGWVVFCGISTIVAYLYVMPNPLYTYILNIWFGLVWFYGISSIVHYLMPDPVFTYICYYSGPEWTWKQWQWRGIPHSPKLQYYRSLTIRLFNVMFRTLVGSLTLLQRCCLCILQPQLTRLISYELNMSTDWVIYIQ